MAAHVLVAEDDRRHAEILRRYLESEGYRATVTHDGRTALEQARRLRPDLVLLDLMLPELDGLDVCRLLRRDSPVPVLMLTARSAEDDLLLGLERGADDYLTKPYSPRELLARIRTLLRRVDRAAQVRGAAQLHREAQVGAGAQRHGAAAGGFRVGVVAIDPERHTVAVGGRPVECTPAEFAILAAMARQPGRVFTRAQLLQQTSGYDRDSTDRTVDTHVLNLRRKIEPNPRRPAHLLTVYGLGYKLVDPADPGLG